MPKLILSFNDENRVKKRVTIEETTFSVGRGDENDLTIPNASLSRFHAKIERFGEIFVLSDNNSSNGTQLNGNDLTTSIALSDGDKITLGGAVNIKVEIADGSLDRFDDDEISPNVRSNAAIYNDAPKVESKQNADKSDVATVQTTQKPRHLIWLVPIGGVFLLLIVTIIFFLLSDGGFTTRNSRKTNIADESNPVGRENIKEDSTANETNSQQNSNAARNVDDEQPQTSNNLPNTNETNVSNTDTAPANVKNSELEAVSENAEKFLRNISRESSPVLTQKQLALINAKIKILKNSNAFRENLRNAAKNNAQFQSIANANGLKPQLLSVFAITKLGDSRGETLSTANAALPNIKRLSEVLGSELANDCLLVMAANADGNAPNEMRDKLTGLARQTPNVSASTIRSIWFLREKNKISESAFDFVVRFIAAGAIAQNPKAFGIEAENLN
ncbi:MAG: FHA domain-containing protein [Pyrinomonadaceae bacterium]|nr:FHA domain-containing protein [Pyrinomonadaceae bacterium]